VLKEIERAVEALKQVPAEYHSLVMDEAAGKGKKKPGPKPGFKKQGKAKAQPAPAAQPKKKPGPKPGFKKKAAAKAKAVEGENLPVKVTTATAEKLEKLRRLKEAKK